MTAFWKKTPTTPPPQESDPVAPALSVHTDPCFTHIVPKELLEVAKEILNPEYYTDEAKQVLAKVNPDSSNSGTIDVKKYADSLHTDLKCVKCGTTTPVDNRFMLAIEEGNVRKIHCGPCFDKLADEFLNGIVTESRLRAKELLADRSESGALRVKKYVDFALPVLGELIKRFKNWDSLTPAEQVDLVRDFEKRPSLKKFADVQYDIGTAVPNYHGFPPTFCEEHESPKPCPYCDPVENYRTRRPNFYKMNRLPAPYAAEEIELKALREFWSWIHERQTGLITQFRHQRGLK